MTDHIKRQPAGIPAAGQFASHGHPPGSGSIAPKANQADMAIAAYEPNTPEKERLELARAAIASHPYSFENVGQDAGEALEYYIDDNAVVLKALDVSGDAVGENPSDFGQILAEQIFDDVNAAEEAKHRAGYAAGRAGRDNNGPALSVHDAGDGPYDARDPKHPGYLDLVTANI